MNGEWQWQLDENVYDDKNGKRMLILPVKMIGDDYANYDIVNYNNDDAKVRNNNIDSEEKDNIRKIRITII